eukprot:Opistho-2@91696
MGQTKLTNVRMRVLVSAALVCCLAGSSLAGTLEDEVWGAGSSFTATDKGSGTVNVVFSPISPTSPVVTTVSKYLVSVDDGVAVPLSPSTTTYDFKNLLGNATHVFNLQVEVLISGVVTIVDSPQSGIAVDVAPYGILWNSVPLAGKAIPNPAIFPTIATVTIDMNRFFRASTGAASLILNSPLKTLGYRCPGASSDTNLDITLSSWKVTCTTVTITCGSSANVTVKATGTVGATASATLSVSGLCHTSWSGKALTFTNRATNAFDISVPYPSAIGSGTLFVAHIYNWDGTTATFLTTSCNSIPSNPGDNTTLSVPEGRTETLAAGKSYRVKFFALVADMDSSTFCTASTPTDPTGAMTINTQYLVGTINTTGENPKWTGSATTSVVSNADSRQLLLTWPKPSFVGSFVAYNVTVVVKDMKTSIVSAPSAVGTPITNVNTLSVLSTMQPSKNYTFTITATSTWDNVRYSSAVTAQEIIGNAYVWPAASDAIVFASTSSALEANRTADPSVAPSDYNVTVTVTGPGGFYYKSPILDIQSDKTYTFRALSADTYGNYTVTYTADGKPGVFNSSVVVLAGCGAPTLKAGQISIDGAGDDAANYYLAVKFTTPAILNANCAPGAVSYRLSFVPKSYTFDDKVNNFNLLSYNADVNIAQFATDGVIRPGSVYDVTLQAYNSGQKFATLLQIITMPYRAAVWLPNPSIPSIDYTNVPAGFKLEWYAPDYPNGPLDRFIAEWYNTENVGTVYSANVSVGVDTYPSNAAKFTYTVTGLRGTEVYVARVKAVSKFGGFISSPVTTPEITIDPTAPEFADGDVVVTPGRSNGDYIITVYLPLYNTTVVSYGNNYDKPTATVACPPNAQLRSPWDGTYICTGLDGFTSYDITVTVSTPGFSTPKKFTAKTLQGEVDWGASAVAIVTPIDSTSLQVVAAAPKKTNGNVVKLVTFVVANNVLALAPIVQKPSSSSSVGFPYKPVISGLKPYTMYSIIICAFTAADTSLDNIPVGATLTANANYNLRASQAPGSILYGRNLTHASAPVWGDSPLVTLTWTSTSSLTVRHASPQAANSDIKTITGKIYTDYTVTAQDTLYIGPISDGPTSSNNADTLVFTVGTAQFVPGQTLYLEITAIGSSDLSPTSIYSSSFHTDLTFEAPVYESDTITGQGITLRTDLTAAGTIVLSKVPLPKTTIFNVTDYIVKVYPNAKCSADSTNFAQFRSIPAASAGLPVRFNGLLPFTQYCVTIDARYNADVFTVYYGAPSGTTRNEAPIFATAFNDTVMIPTSTDKRALYLPFVPAVQTKNGVVNSYRVILVNTALSTVVSTVDVVATELNRRVKFTGLLPYTRYHVYVEATSTYDDAGTSNKVVGRSVDFGAGYSPADDVAPIISTSPGVVDITWAPNAFDDIGDKKAFSITYKLEQLSGSNWIPFRQGGPGAIGGKFSFTGLPTGNFRVRIDTVGGGVFVQPTPPDAVKNDVVKLSFANGTAADFRQKENDFKVAIAKALSSSRKRAAAVTASDVTIVSALQNGPNVDVSFYVKTTVVIPSATILSAVAANKQDISLSTGLPVSSAQSTPVAGTQVQAAPSSKSSSNGGAIAGAVIGVLGFAAICVGGIVYYRRRQQFYHHSVDKGGVPLTAVSTQSMDHLGGGGTAARAISAEKLPERITALHANSDMGFSEEYESLLNDGFSTEAALAGANKNKNRYANVLPFDHTRVKLTPIPGVEGSDYINGNFVDGYNKRNAYIATQGPVPDTFDDFWRMMWEQRSSVIAMVTNEDEKGRIKCHRYWPEPGSATYGFLEVTLVNQETPEDFIIRTFSMKNLKNGETRTIHHLQFTGWPDHGVPSSTRTLLRFISKSRDVQPKEAGPIVVHCSAGVGRTGTFIAADVLLQRMQTENLVDVFNFVNQLRRQRMYMVQTEDQYIFVYSTLADALHDD